MMKVIGKTENVKVSWMIWQLVKQILGFQANSKMKLRRDYPKKYLTV